GFPGFSGCLTSLRRLYKVAGRRLYCTKVCDNIVAGRSVPMSEAQRYRVIGGPGSPYSFKMRAVLRYRRIPHDWVVPPKFQDSEGELAKAGKGIIPVMQLPDGRYWADATPMILAL